MIQVVAVTLRRVILVLHLRADGVGGGGAARVLLEIFLEKLVLDRFRERVDCISGLGFARSLGNRDAIADGQDAFGADEAESGTLAPTIYKIDTQCQVE